MNIGIAGSSASWDQPIPFLRLLVKSTTPGVCLQLFSEKNRDEDRGGDRNRVRDRHRDRDDERERPAAHACMNSFHNEKMAAGR